MPLSARLLLPLVALGLLAPIAPPARAEAPERGYLWSIVFPFENDFNGILTIKVGPWQDGDLVSVDETSQTTVLCRRVGNVTLNGGDALFAGGYLTCGLDLATAVAKNHGLTIPPVDSYGSIVLRVDAETHALNVAPIFTHPDAAYTINFTNPSSVALSQDLTNDLGPQLAPFPGLPSTMRRVYTFQHACVWEGPCNGSFLAGPEFHFTPAGGDRARFQTGPATILIGGDGATTFSGRMGGLLIDPGNSVH